MKQAYETPEVEIIEFETEDVIGGSGGGGNTTGDIFDGQRTISWP